MFKEKTRLKKRAFLYPTISILCTEKVLIFYTYAASKKKYSRYKAIVFSVNAILSLSSRSPNSYKVYFIVWKNKQKVPFPAF